MEKRLLVDLLGMLVVEILSKNISNYGTLKLEFVIILIKPKVM
jgi:hypothetical protein